MCVLIPIPDVLGLQLASAKLPQSADAELESAKHCKLRFSQLFPL
jgi:hypothetical protein